MTVISVAAPFALFCLLAFIGCTTKETIEYVGPNGSASQRNDASVRRRRRAGANRRRANRTQASEGRDSRASNRRRSPAPAGLRSGRR